jgi:hypothetical protein
MNQESQLNLHKPPFSTEFLFFTFSAGMKGSLSSGMSRLMIGNNSETVEVAGPIDTVSMCWVVYFRSSSKAGGAVVAERAPSLSHPMARGVKGMGEDGV